LTTVNKFGKNCLTTLLILSGFTVFGLSALYVALSAAIMIPGRYLLAMLFLYGMYIYFIKAPTKLGAQTVSELQGFKMYLKTAEEHRLNILTPPERTPELFEKLLPYAIALNVENAWGKKFTKILERLNYEPDWYRGDKPFASSRIPSSFSSSFTSSVRSARKDPARSSSSGGSWSSGSHGRGSSGGGGGGGGGRGW